MDGSESRARGARRAAAVSEISGIFCFLPWLIMLFIPRQRRRYSKLQHQD